MIENSSVKPSTPIKNSGLEITRILHLVSHLYPRHKFRKLDVITPWIQIACEIKNTGSTEHFFVFRDISWRDPLLCFTDSFTCCERVSNERLLLVYKQYF